MSSGCRDERSMARFWFWLNQRSADRDSSLTLRWNGLRSLEIE